MPLPVEAGGTALHQSDALGSRSNTRSFHDCRQLGASAARIGQGCGADECQGGGCSAVTSGRACAANVALRRTTIATPHYTHFRLEPAELFDKRCGDDSTKSLLYSVGLGLVGSSSAVALMLKPQ